MEDKFKLNDLVVISIKPLSTLKNEGWQENEAEQLWHKESIYKFTSKKRQFIGKTLKGKIKINSLGQKCVEVNGKLRFNKKMIKTITKIGNNYEPFVIHFNGLFFVGEANGSLFIKKHDKSYSLNKFETQKLIQHLANFHGWIK